MQPSSQRLALVLGVAGLAAALTFGLSDRAPVERIESAQVCGDNLLVNPSFDEPAVASAWRPVSETAMPGWFADPGSTIEVWADGFLGFDSHSGANLIELNYVGQTLIYQDVATTPGTELTWSSHHRSRLAGDAVEVLVGPPGGELTALSSTETPLDFWMELSGTYVVPTGQTSTRFGLRGLTPSGAGNLADDPYLAISCEPEPPVVDVIDDGFVFAELVDGRLDLAINDIMLVTFPFGEEAVVPPTKGTVVITPDGYADYTPNQGATGIDTFVYELCGEDEGGAVCDTATVTIDLG